MELVLLVLCAATGRLIRRWHESWWGDQFLRAGLDGLVGVMPKKKQKTEWLSVPSNRSIVGIRCILT
jgi:hypothetical protein